MDVKRVDRDAVAVAKLRLVAVADAGDAISEIDLHAAGSSGMRPL